MKIIRYKIADEINIGTEDKPSVVKDIHEVSVPWSETYEEIAKKEAYNGEITVEDDGQPEPEPSREERLEKEVVELKTALNLLLTGVTE